MDYSYHDLVIFKASATEVKDAIISWVEESKFRLVGRQTASAICAVYPGWHGLGITDRQTGTRLEILLQEANGFTALSVHHHPKRWFIFTGAIFGEILREEVESLIAHIQRSHPRVGS